MDSQVSLEKSQSRDRWTSLTLTYSRALCWPLTVTTHCGLSGWGLGQLPTHLLDRAALSAEVRLGELCWAQWKITGTSLPPPRPSPCIWWASGHFLEPLSKPLSLLRLYYSSPEHSASPSFTELHLPAQQPPAGRASRPSRAQPLHTGDLFILGGNWQNQSALDFMKTNDLPFYLIV